MFLYIAIFLFSILAILFYKEDQRDQKEVENVRNTEKAEDIQVKNDVIKTSVNYDGANIMTAKGPGNTCIAIFKNPVDHKTHFYRTRLKGKKQSMIF